jgi:NTP pyrophosphatase (non-canonical NTP hydrolase)
MNRTQIYELIDAERQRQHDKWAGKHRWGQGDCSSIHIDKRTKLAVLTEETGEVARAVLEDDPKQLQTELVQTAAVAVAWLETNPLI